MSEKPLYFFKARRRKLGLRTALRWEWRSLRYWLRGREYGIDSRFRCCGHTTPYHYQWCPVGEVNQP